MSDTINKILAVLKKLDDWITEIPPTPQPTRFGNKAFRTWLAKVVEVRCTPSMRMHLLTQSAER